MQGGAACLAPRGAVWMHVTKCKLTGALTCVVLLAPVLARAQNPMMASSKAQHDMAKGYVLKTAEVIPENLYSFKATPDVRSIAQLIGHITDATTSICGGAG